MGTGFLLIALALPLLSVCIIGKKIHTLNEYELMAKDIEMSEFRELKKRNKRLNQRWSFFFEDLKLRDVMAIHF